MKRIFVLLCLFLCHIAVFAQQPANVEMADTMRSSGKIYVVISHNLHNFYRIGHLFVLDRQKIKKNRKRKLVQNLNLCCLNMDL